MKLPKPDVILFDIDDTLYSTETIHKAALLETISTFSDLYGVQKAFNYSNKVRILLN